MKHRNGHHITRALSASGLLFAAGLLLSCLAQDFTFNDGFRVGGNVARNVGTVVLKNTVSGETVSVTGSGGFIFSKMQESGDAYNIVNIQDPADQTCTVYNPSGTIGDDVNNVVVLCSTISKQANNFNLHVASEYPAFDNPSPAGTITVTLGVASDVLVTMTSTLRTSANGVSYARLLVDGNPIAQGRASTTIENTYSMTFSQVVTLAPGSHTITSAFASSLPPVSGKVIVDELVKGIMTATVLPTVPGYRRYTAVSMSGMNVTSSANNETRSIPELNSDTGVLAGDRMVIGMLPLLETNWSSISIIGFDLLANGAIISSATAQNNQIDEYIPMTQFAAGSFPVGTSHAFGAQCRIAAASTSVVVENVFPTVLSGIVMDTYTTQSGVEQTARTFSSTTWTGTTTTSYSEIPTNSLVMSNSYTINSPSRLLVAVVLDNSKNNSSNNTASFAIGIGNCSNIIGETCVSNNAGGLATPVTLIAITDSPLLAGITNVNLYVKTSPVGSTVTITQPKLTVMRLD